MVALSLELAQEVAQSNAASKAEALPLLHQDLVLELSLQRSKKKVSHMSGVVEDALAPAPVDSTAVVLLSMPFAKQKAKRSRGQLRRSTIVRWESIYHEARLNQVI